MSNYCCWNIVLYVDQWHIRWRCWLIWLCGGWRGLRRWNLWRLNEDRGTSWKGERSLKPDFTVKHGVCAFHHRAKQLLQQQQKCGVDKRECCLQEIRQTEEKYSETLESVMQVGKREQRLIYIRPSTQHKLKRCLLTFAALSETSWKVSAASRHWQHLHQHRGLGDEHVLVCSLLGWCTCVFVSTSVLWL